MTVRLSERCLSDGQSDITRAIKESSIVMILSDAVLRVCGKHSHSPIGGSAFTFTLLLHISKQGQPLLYLLVFLTVNSIIFLSAERRNVSMCNLSTSWAMPSMARMSLSVRAARTYRTLCRCAFSCEHCSSASPARSLGRRPGTDTNALVRTG